MTRRARLRPAGSLILLSSLCALCALCGKGPAADWVHWRGPFQTGFSPETDLPETWSPDPKADNNNLVWKAPYGCRSTPVVMNGRVYILNYAAEQDKDPKSGEVTERPETIQERVMCFDADN